MPPSKFKAPSWAAPPKTSIATIDVQKAGVVEETIRLDSKPYYLLGRTMEADIPHPHDSVSREHAALVYHESGKLYVIDLASTHGTRYNGQAIDANKPTKIVDGTKLQFGASEREYIFSLQSKRDSDEGSSAVITRTLEEATERIQKFRDQIVAGEATLKDLAKTESDCSSAKRGGDLGFFERGQMQPSFEKAAFALDVGQLSELVYSDSGVHIIERVE